MNKLIGPCLAALLFLTSSSASQPKVKDLDGVVFDIQPRVISAGDTAVLSWSIKDATKVLIEETSESRGELHQLGTFGGTGTLQVKPKGNTTYVLTCEGSKTFCVSATVRVRVKPR